ncbi:hypothetical protein LCGC14_2657120, partial [marine sediment metagenome]
SQYRQNFSGSWDLLAGILLWVGGFLMGLGVASL